MRFGNGRGLKKYLLHELLTPDNNFIKDAIQPFVLGRRN